MKKDRNPQVLFLFWKYIPYLGRILLAQLVWINSHITLTPGLWRIIQNGNNRYSFFIGFIDFPFQGLLRRALQQNAVHLGRNTHIHKVRHGIGG